MRILPRPLAAPHKIPLWAWHLQHWYRNGKQGPRPTHPRPLPKWFHLWRLWYLARARGRGSRAWNRYLREIGRGPLTPVQRARRRIVAHAHWAVARTARMFYTEDARRDDWLVAKDPHMDPQYTDCSGMDTEHDYAAKVPDPNGLDYRWLGYTGTRLDTAYKHGHVTTDLRLALEGDGIVVGPGTGWHEFTVVKADPVGGNPWVATHGRDGVQIIRANDDPRMPKRLCQILPATSPAHLQALQVEPIPGGTTMWLKLQQHFHYTTATLLAIIAAAITVATTLGLHVSPNLRDQILQLAGLILGGIVVGGGMKSNGMLRAGIHPLNKAAMQADLASLHATISALPWPVPGENRNTGESDMTFERTETSTKPAHVGIAASAGDGLGKGGGGNVQSGPSLHPRHRAAGDNLHPILQAHGSFAGLKLGKGAPKLDARTPILGEFMEARLGIKLPKQTDWLAPVADELGGDFGMMGNDTYGDCTCAALGHAIQVWTGTLGSPVTLTAAQILALYWATGTQDDGRAMFEMLKHVSHNGIAGHQIGAYVGLGLRRYGHRDVRAAIDLFGGAYLGVGLPKSAQTQAVWDVTGDPTKPGPSEWGSWGGHAIWGADYDHDGVDVVTWGHTQKMTWAFLDAYGDEGYAIIAPDWLKAGKTIEGIDLAALTAYLATIKSKNYPAATG